MALEWSYQAVSVAEQYHGRVAMRPAAELARRGLQPLDLIQRNEDALPGWTLVEQVFICGSVMFCDNYIIGGGTLIGADRGCPRFC